MNPPAALPYLLEDLAPLGGTIKTRPEDFEVEEVSLYEPSGEGTHTYFTIEKRQLDTMRAIDDIARALGRRGRDIGAAGRKDADAVTRQTLSLEHIDPDRIRSLQIPRIKILAVSRHTNKLKIGHLRGNRFIIKIRNVDTNRIDEVRGALETLARVGVPNYFGPQRFGLRGDTWKVGLAALRRDIDQAVDVLLGQPSDLDEGTVRQAREHYQREEFAEAAQAWPFPFRAERIALKTLARTGGNKTRAFHAIPKHLIRFYYSAAQSYLFNQVVAPRIRNLGNLQIGDLAYRHAGGAVFRVEDLAAEQPRCDAFEISPSGPIFGYRMTQPEGTPGQVEQDILRDAELTLDDFRNIGPAKMKGARRSLRFQPGDISADAGTDDLGPYIELRFFLAPGCYATTLLREICKTDFVEEVAD